MVLIDKETYTFKLNRPNTDDSTDTNIEYSIDFEWDSHTLVDVLKHFSYFLDGCGYSTDKIKVLTGEAPKDDE